MSKNGGGGGADSSPVSARRPSYFATRASYRFFRASTIRPFRVPALYRLPSRTVFSANSAFGRAAAQESSPSSGEIAASPAPRPRSSPITKRWGREARWRAHICGSASTAKTTLWFLEK